MANQDKLDTTDIKMLKILQQNSRLTVKELAAKVNLSPTPAFERQKRLERDGYIQRYAAIADHHKLGNNVIVLCNIRLKQHTHDLIQQFMDAVQSIDQITECYNTTGDYETTRTSCSIRLEILVVLGACTALSLSERLRTHTLYQWQDTKKETTDKASVQTKPIQLSFCSTLKNILICPSHYFLPFFWQSSL